MTLFLYLGIPIEKERKENKVLNKIVFNTNDVQLSSREISVLPATCVCVRVSVILELQIVVRCLLGAEK